MAKKKQTSVDNQQLTIDDFNAVVNDIRSRFPALSADDLFVLWFFRAYVTESESKAAEAVAGGAKDKGIDGIFVDDAMRCVFVVQAKYRKSLGQTTEKRPDVVSFAEIAFQLSNPSNEEFAKFAKTTHELVATRLKEARERVLKRQYRVWLYFFTLGNVSSSICDDAQSQVQSAPCDANIEVIDAKRATRLLRDYLDGVAPPIPALNLEMEQGSTVKINGIAQRYDEQNHIESWVFSMRGSAIADLYKFAGIRLFARNVRGFLGTNTAINRGMIDTLKHQPDRFFYYNNGITILCDEAKMLSQQGKHILHVCNPQVINGQQTTRTLAAHSDLADKASVLVKVIRVEHRLDQASAFESLLSRIVSGTNWQNPIRTSDLMSNDRIQIELERSLRKLGYAYIRKRQTKSEAKRTIGNKHLRCIQKEEVAQIIAACEIDPTTARAAKDKLFEEQLYDNIFTTADPLFYLTRYWLMRLVAYCARGIQPRREARFVVLNFAWAQIGPSVRSALKARDFIEKCEQNSSDFVGPLFRAINLTFDAARRLYTLNRGVGAEAVDVPTFFKSKRASAKAFREFWNDGCKDKDKIQKSFDKAIALIGN